MPKFKLLLLLLLLSLFMATQAKAQNSLVLPAVEVDLWPEYDDPGMLVIYRIELPTTVSLPTEIKLRLPAAAGKPNAVAGRQPDGSLVNLAFEQQAAGEWSTITVTAVTPQIQVEYYDPSLQKNDAQRAYRYQWPGDYAVDSFNIQIQQPVDASSMVISPDNIIQGVQGQDGLTYYTKEIGQVPAGMPFDLSINYHKPSDQLTISRLQVEPAMPAEVSANNLSTWLPWILATLGVGLIVGSLVWYLRSNRDQASAKTNRARHKAAKQKNPAASAPSGPVYCHKCGKRAMEGDRFCRNCGEALRL